MDPSDFRGAKIALICEGRLIAYQRDEKPEIPFPGMWDLPGGGREEDETPAECAIRETREEFGISIDPSSIVWERYYPAKIPGAPGTYFHVAHLAEGFGDIVFGEEGQRFEIMSLQQFLAHPLVVDNLKDRLRHYLAETE
ncbi:NUDIX domain-containing protein [Shinella sp. G-2]|uniref:NUDIX domain-containing protein n=1 Tax=Shinella sp. G-2 TaxID=3133141 RepID=UPI003CFDE740